jgi:hypothetical protein
VIQPIAIAAAASAMKPSVMNATSHRATRPSDEGNFKRTLTMG